MSREVLEERDEVLARLSQGTLEGCTVTTDLTGADLKAGSHQDITFSGTKFDEGTLERSDLRRITFKGCEMPGVKMTGARLRGCTVENSEMMEAQLDHVALSGTRFLQGSKLFNVNFTGSHLGGCEFHDCALSGARFVRTLVMETRFRSSEPGNVTLDGADFSRAVLVDCDLANTSLYGAIFENALLVNVNLSQATLREARFEGAHLINVDLRGVELDPRQERELEQARADDPWSKIGFLREMLAEHSPEELQAICEMLLRTYVVGQGKATTNVESLASAVTQLRAQQPDLPGLDALRVRGDDVEVQVRGEWETLDVDGAAVRDAGAPVPEPGAVPAPSEPSGTRETSAPPPPQVSGPESTAPEGSGEEISEESSPLDTGTFRKLRHLEID